VDLESVRSDLGHAARIGLGSKVVRLLGGEPLLHPNLIEIIRAVRASGLFDEIHVVTNGTMLDQTSDEFWNEVDRVELSLYPGVLAYVPENPEPKLDVRRLTTFHETFSTLRNNDKKAVEQIWNTCKIRNFCYGLMGGHFYKCMRAPYISRFLNVGENDGIRLDTATSETVRDYIDSKDPLAACWNCTGTCGKTFPHAQVNGDEWRQLQSRPLEKMLK
jgi:hypothetical protein